MTFRFHRLPASSFPPAAPTPAIEAESEESERVGGQERERAREGEQKREGEIEREPESSSFLYIPPPRLLHDDDAGCASTCRLAGPLSPPAGGQTRLVVGPGSLPAGGAAGPCRG